MLNEGYALTKSMERYGIVPTQRYPDIKKLGKKKGLIVGINEEGKVASIEFRNAVDMSKLWKISDGLKNSFPGMTLSLCLLNLDSYYQDGGNQLTKTPDINVLKNIWQSYGLNLKLKKKNGKEIKLPMFADWQSTMEKLQKRRADVENIAREANAYKILLDRMLNNNYEDSDREIATAITEQIFLNIDKGMLLLDDVKDFLMLDEPGVFIFFDVSDFYDDEKYQNRVASVHIINYISECLLKQSKIDKSDSDNSNNISSALSGKVNANIVDKFPDPNLNFIGITQLFGVDKNTPCLKRYNQIGTEIFPVDTEEANAIQDSLVWITDENRKGKTWYPVPGSNESESDLLIVYLESKPDLKVNKAYLLGGVSKNDFSDSTYEAIASTAIKALKAEEINKAHDLIRLFAIRKADKMRRQISLQRVYAISDLVKADEVWHNAAKNIPNVTMPFFRKEIERITAKQETISSVIKTFLEDDKSKMINLKPNCPFPGDLVRLTQKQWIRGGTDFTSIAGCSIGDIYDVFFPQENNKQFLIKNLMDKTIQCTQTLLIGSGGADHKKEVSGFNLQARFTVLRTVVTFGIYLNKLGITKEIYMKDTFFYVGRFLSLLDTLHFEYCNNVRSGSIPPQLLGNAHLQIALDNPVTAIDMLAKRIGVYQAWAKKEQGENVKLAKWTIGELGKITDLLSEKDIPSSTSSVERAQILLGYLARSEGKTDANPVNASKENKVSN